MTLSQMGDAIMPSHTLRGPLPDRRRTEAPPSRMPTPKAEARSPIRDILDAGNVSMGEKLMLIEALFAHDSDGACRS